MKNKSTIIPVSQVECQSKSWKVLLKTAIHNPAELLRMVGVAPSSLDFAVDLNNSFTMRVPQPFIDKMQYGDAKDPLLLQVLSQQQENLEVDGYTSDPLGELNFQQPGLLHKYHGRVLLLLASACAVNCRYCFRRHFPYQDSIASGAQLARSLDYIRANQSISEVILSGGDPLMVSDQSIASLLKQLNNISSIKRLRIHTRLPVVIPQRITEALITALTNSRFQLSMVLHINHPNEIDELLIKAMQRLRSAGIQLLNQSVLLKGINDQSSVLTALSEKLFEAGIIPYYLHLLDKVAGASHFATEQSQAIDLVKQIRNKLPGYLVPRLAIEESGKLSKTIIAS